MLAGQAFDVVPLGRSAGSNDPDNYHAIGDYTEVDDWSSLLAGADVVIHLAAMVHQLQEVGELAYRHMNVDVSARIAEAARQAGVRRFIFLSTVKVNGEVTARGRPFSGTDKPAPEDAYGRSKHLAEIKLQEIFSGSDTELVIIRPPLVYGPRVKANFAMLVRLARLPLPLPLAAVCNRRDMVSLYNLSEFIVLCCTHPQAPASVWMVADSAPYSLASLIAEIRAAQGRSPWLFKFPPKLLKIALAAAGKSAWSSRLFSDLQVDTTPSREILGWIPRFDFAETMAIVINGRGRDE
jgi:UDP-glucose 4-epimerase